MPFQRGGEKKMRDKGQTDGFEQKEVTCSHQQCPGWMMQLLDGGRGIRLAEKSPSNQWLREDKLCCAEVIRLHFSVSARRLSKQHWKLCIKSCAHAQTLEGPSLT